MDNLKTTSSEALRERQIALEQEAVMLGVKRYEEAMTDQSASLPGMQLLKKAIDPTALLIEAFIERAGDGKAGRKHAALPYVTKVAPEEAAFLTARAAINGATGAKTAQAVALSIAASIQDHLNIVRLAEDHPKLYRKVAEQLKKSTSGRHRSAVFRKVVTKYGQQEVTWNDRERLLLGMKLLELFIEATDMVKLVQVSEGAKNTPVKVHFGDEWAEVLAKAHNQCALLQPVHLPMVHPPRDWRNPYTGGYLTSAIRARLVRTRSREYLDELGSVDLTRVLDAVNLIQSTPWQINRKVLTVLTELWTSESVVAGLPSLRPVELPPRPFGIPEGVPVSSLPIEQQEDMKVWKMKAAAAHEAEASRQSEVAQLSKKLGVAKKFAGEEAIYFPHYLDFRGRVYPMASYLNPQGDDVAKGLLQFAEGKPLGETGGFWLAVHIANLFGVDKVPFDERVQWVLDNEEKILESAIDPVHGECFWHEADKPFCALAACFEWAGFKVHGDAYVSHLPIAMDGSCSGLQHFSAMLRDEVGGAAVNLVPGERPADVYVAVSKLAQAMSDASGTEWASVWEGKFCRDVAKQPTMTLCYSATKRGMGKQVLAALGKLDAKNGGRWLNGDADNYPAATYAADIIWTSLAEIVVAARGAMDWLQAATKLLAKANLPTRWTTPMGLPVMQAYRKLEGRRVRAAVEGRFVDLMLTIETDEIDGRRQASGIAPNFVHSMDSSHLMATAALARINGIGSLAVIHDSFGTHACDTNMLHAVIREAFVEQYAPNVLARFRDEVVDQLSKVAPELVEELPPLPPMGSLDLDAVRESDYLFA